ncbi:unnamed protein product [Clonostachys solani]|uniref:glycerophosphodiester phosphodiesterase n=1 Tax=Clonostachys solani TaxID=160281 RepID=A0A9P0EN80_9HYPO|nr:unnamed protein product [Clonostachys solani]
MRCSLATGLAALVATTAAASCSSTNSTNGVPAPPKNTSRKIKRVDLGPRPGYLVDDMDESPLKTELQQCLDTSTKPWKASTWSIGHRGGGTLNIPEHSVQSNMAGARMGAGILECDTAFTSDLELVCRHSQCDLHYTTNIVAIPELNAKCITPFTPAAGGKPATANCCTADITLAEFKTLCATMEGFNASAVTPEDFINNPPSWRTDLYSHCGKVLSVQDHIKLTKELGLLHTAELKTPEVPMPFNGNYTQEIYAQQLVDEYRKGGVPPEDLYLQSFLYDDMLFWLKNEPEYAAQAVFLDSYGETEEELPNAVANLTNYKADGVKYLSPPLPYLISAENGKMVMSEYAIKAKELGFKIIPWTVDRSGSLYDVKENNNYYFMYFKDAVNKDGDVFTMLDLMWKEIGIVAIFSDWSATLTFYANCFKIGLF